MIREKYRYVEGCQQFYISFNEYNNFVDHKLLNRKAVQRESKLLRSTPIQHKQSAHKHSASYQVGKIEYNETHRLSLNNLHISREQQPKNILSRANPHRKKYYMATPRAIQNPITPRSPITPRIYDADFSEERCMDENYPQKAHSMAKLLPGKKI